MIRLSNGYQFEFMAASGSLGFDGRGWWHPKYWILRWNLTKHPDLLIAVIKTLTLQPETGQSRAIYDGEDFIVNAVGLFNPEIEQWKSNYLPKIKKNQKIILSITEKNIARVSAMASEIDKVVREENNKDKIVGIEFNVSCPNIAKVWLPKDIIKACRQIKKQTNLPLGLKIGYHQDYYLRIAKKTQDLVEWLSFNAIPWEMVFPGQESPLMKKFGVKGAVSGKAIQKFNEDIALKIKRTDVKTSVVVSSVGWGRSFEEGYEDLLENLNWADAISFGSLFMKHPLWPIRMILKYRKEKKWKEIPKTRAWWQQR